MLGIIFWLFISIGLWSWIVILIKGSNTKQIRSLIFEIYNSVKIILIATFKLLLLLLKDILFDYSQSILTRKQDLSIQSQERDSFTPIDSIPSNIDESKYAIEIGNICSKFTKSQIP